MIKVRARYILLALLLLLLAGGGVGLWLWREHQEDRHRLVTVRRHVLYRARQPDVVERSALDRREIRRVVNLRPRAESPTDFDREVRQCQALGLTMVNLPVYNTIPTDDQVLEFLRLVRDGNGAVLVHCAQGRARTGVMVAAFRVVVDGWTPADAYAELTQYWKGVPVGDERAALRHALLERLATDRGQWLESTAPGATTRPQSAPASVGSR